MSIKTWRGYRFQRWVFRIASIIIMGYALALVLVYGFETNLFYHCPLDAQGWCRNPFYGECDGSMGAYCEQSSFPPGFTHGTKPSSAYLNYGLISMLTVALAFLVNHLAYNRARWWW